MGQFQLFVIRIGRDDNCAGGNKSASGIGVPIVNGADEFPSQNIFFGMIPTICNALGGYSGCK
ncbi:MAG: hypothetical protein B7Y49_02290 [Sphingomonas sp. 28-62-11]|nr:MAG: hypothetical protein B7Y49_02290 [Sphingomonas sp. 28-62-11]